TELEHIERSLLLEAIFLRSGYDFRSYAEASIRRRISQFLSMSGLDSIAQMIPPALHDDAFLARLIHYFSICVTEMFRDPFVYEAIRTAIIPHLRTYPHIKIWHAGCATGEEVYSMAIMLQEEGLLDRTTLYATDLNSTLLATAKAGIYPIDDIREATRNYIASGGKHPFSDYYHCKYDAATMDSSLRQRITFANHNLVTDGVFGEMHLIFCRNVLIYFNHDLQNKVLKLFTGSLIHRGFLCLGTKETLEFTGVKSFYETVDPKAKLYRKVLDS
ncbi:protein-glutamate O-methyltransferase CheR, partial [Myxococcota bacterium]|nr:protein-glutamate O-methyltransferase CheR [Myxococcota bacterium]